MSKAVATDLDPRDMWGTPADLFAGLDAEFDFAVDLAASPGTAKCAEWIGPEEDSLSIGWARSWPGRWLFLNPPFSKLGCWMAKVAYEADEGAHIVAIVPGHRHEQSWFQDFVLHRAHRVLVPRGRVKYDAPPGIKSSSPAFPSLALVYDGPNPGGVTEMRSL